MATDDIIHVIPLVGDVLQRLNYGRHLTVVCCWHFCEIVNTVSLLNVLRCGRMGNNDVIIYLSAPPIKIDTRKRGFVFIQNVLLISLLEHFVQYQNRQHSWKTNKHQNTLAAKCSTFIQKNHNKVLFVSHSDSKSHVHVRGRMFTELKVACSHSIPYVNSSYLYDVAPTNSSMSGTP